MKPKLFPILWIIIVFTILNLLQATFTELDPDEAYYWMYAKQLDWGYFDHPPAVAVMIKLSSWLFDGELGVRFITVMMGSVHLYLIWLLAGKPEDRRDLLLLIVLLAAMPMFQIYGFITTPDPPLLFFTTLFFLIYQAFLLKEKWVYTFLLGICMALLLYSKYHGILVILFTLASNLKLLRNPRFYVASIFGACLFVPHLYWQFEQEFPSLKYHLVGRNDPYQLKHTLNYLANQLLNFGPLLFPLWIMSLWQGPSKTALLRAFFFNVIAIWGFFLVFTGKGHPEPQWTAVLCVPLALLGFNYLKNQERYRRLFTNLAVFMVILLFLARIIMVADWSKRFLPQFHKEEWVKAMQEQAGDLPVVFLDHYRDPSTYSFYSGDETTALNFPVGYRRNQFDIWDWEKRYHNKKVMLVALNEWQACPAPSFFEMGRKKNTFCRVGPIQIVQKVFFDLENLPDVFNRNEITLEVPVKNPYDHDIDFNKPSWPVSIRVLAVQGEEKYTLNVECPLEALKAQQSLTVPFKFDCTDLPQGTYQLAVMLTGGELLFSINSDFYEVEMKR